MTNHYKTPDGQKPVIGDPATYSIGSDRYSMTVFKVSSSGKTIWVRHDSVTAGPGHDYYGEQNWICKPSRNGTLIKASWRWKSGVYRESKTGGSGSIRVGVSSHYEDPSF